ncbi:hypothetical protein CEXT_181731 [Caerostris extrusa]|uniref:Uncharacterized protein n=1 Tax=Caerostris extrusa TaxID=172846 RepID=A0AAV4TIE4_CAEEX|nr:hypothetical protein CEXT_181731 [Caerostris extrusa]
MVIYALWMPLKLHHHPDDPSSANFEATLIVYEAVAILRTVGLRHEQSRNLFVFLEYHREFSETSTLYSVLPLRRRHQMGGQEECCNYNCKTGSLVLRSESN